MQVREIMTANPKCCTPDSTLQEVAKMMVENDCGCIPVVKELSNKKPVGTITDRDITIRTVAAGQNPVPMKASDIMSIDIATVKPNQSLEECLKAMEEKDIRRILVVDENGDCCGIVAQEDIVRNNHNPVRTNEFIREISESSPSRHMTMSKDLESSGSPLSVRAFLPLLVGIGSGAALSYALGKKKTYRTEESHQQPTRQFKVTTQPATTGRKVNTSHLNIENHHEEVSSETRTPARKGERP
jgi:CBS domain-containing protein